MNPLQKSVFVFGLYSLLMGMVLLFIPQLILPIFKLNVLGEPWLNLLGFVLMCSSYYYIRSALSDTSQFALYTIHTRLAAPAVVLYLVLSGKADWHFISFGIVDGLGGCWTWYEFRRHQRTHSSMQFIQSNQCPQRSTDRN